MLITGLQERATDAPPDAIPAEAADGARSVRPPRIHFPQGRVRVLAGGRAGSTIELDRVVATFGRPGDQLAVITRRPHGYFITHVEGRRYPRVNGATLGKEARVLHHGDVIDVADEKLEFGLD